MKKALLLIGVLIPLLSMSYCSKPQVEKIKWASDLDSALAGDTPVLALFYSPT